MRFLIVLLLLQPSCTAVHAYDIPDVPQCVIDQCTATLCSVETPEGWVDIPRKDGYFEGKKIDCPIELIEPT